MERETRADVLLQLDLQRIRTSGVTAKNNEGLNDLSAFRIGNSDDGNLGYRGVFYNYALHIEWTDAIAGGGDNIVASPEEIEIPVGVLLHCIPGQIPFAPETWCTGVPIAVEEEEW